MPTYFQSDYRSLAARSIRSAIVLLSGVIALAGCASNQAPKSKASAQSVQSQAPAELIRRYPDSPALRATFDTHLAASATRGRDSLFMTTWFAGPDATVSVWSSIDSLGKVTKYRFVYDSAVEDTQKSTLAVSQRPELLELLQTLPPSAPPATIDRLLIASFRQNGEWVTRFYDRTAPPDGVRRIFREMTGAPLALNERR